MREQRGDDFDTLCKNDVFWMDGDFNKHKISEMDNEYCYHITLYLRKRNVDYDKQFIIPDSILKKYHEHIQEFPEILL